MFKNYRLLNYSSDMHSVLLIPLVNVLFLTAVLIYIFSFFTVDTTITVKLPKTVTSQVVSGMGMVITITGENVIYFNNKITTVKELEKELKSKSWGENQFLIRSDRRASAGRIMDIWDICRRAGIDKINVATTK
ncbi:MAG: biopolymer transporter ExbD [Candidatus Omnitrophica bacterium]|nr:biopolymer transporter ExbD [Candidatus Omnitrophota bacterium]